MKTNILREDTRQKFMNCHDGEMTIVVGEDAYTNLQVSLAHAKQLCDSGRYERVIYINLPFSRRRFSGARAEVIGEPLPPHKMQVYHVMTGQLSSTVKAVGAELARPERTALIVNSWEMASSSYRFREDLIFALYNLQAEHELSVFVYSVGKADSVAAGRRNRTGLGKLTLAAENVISLTESAEEKPQYFLSELVHLKGDAKKEYIKLFEEQQARSAAARGEEYEQLTWEDYEDDTRAGNIGDEDGDDGEDEILEDADEPRIVISPSGECVELPASEINELAMADGHQSGGSGVGDRRFGNAGMGMRESGIGMRESGSRTTNSWLFRNDKITRQ
jgi:hypothetical protein